VVVQQDRDTDPQLVEEDLGGGQLRSCSMLDIYRWCAYREGDHGDYEGAARQLDAAR
jgi:hypothetical protein